MLDRGERRQIEALANTTRAVEEQLKEQRAQLARLQAQQERLTPQLEGVANRVETLVFGQQNLTAQFQVAQATQEQLHALRDQVGGWLDRQAALEARTEDLTKQRLTTVERERLDRESVTRRLDQVERAVAAAEQRVIVIEEIGRRVQETGAGMIQRLERLEQTVEAVVGRAGRTLEAAKRLETNLDQLESLADTLQRQDEAVLERVELLSEVLRRLEDEVSVLSGQEGRYQDLIDKLEAQRVERARLEETMHRLERALDEEHQLLEHLSHVIATLEGRSNGLSERLEHIGQELMLLRDQTVGQFQRLVQLEERHRRRQVQEIETEIRDLKRNLGWNDSLPTHDQPA